MTPDLTGSTRLIALIADPVEHVRAQLALNAEFTTEGVDAAVVPLNVGADRLSATFEMSRAASNVAGLLVTVPHKTAVAALCDDLGPNATELGAANAVRFDPDGRAIGEIFDGVGLVAAARANSITFTDKRVLVVGTGGAGTAVAAAIAAESPAELTLSNRTEQRAADLAEQLASLCSTAVGSPSAAGHDVVVNCTSLGLRADDALPIDLDGISSDAAVIDIIANPEWTALRRIAADAGHPTMGGGPMIQHQLAAIRGHILGS